MKNLFISLLLLTAASGAQARSSFEILREAFHKAANPATLEDFEQDAWENCTFADVTSPHLTRDTQVRVLRLNTPPGRGPLFPGDNDSRVDVFSDYNLDRHLHSFFQSSYILETKRNFVQALNGPPWRPMNIYGRTDDEMLFFRVDISDFQGPNAPLYERVYGYCWNENSHDGEDNGEAPEQPLPIPPNPR